MRKSALCLLLIVAVAVLIGSGGRLRAAPPDDLKVTIDFDKDYFDIAEPVGVTVTLTNNSLTRSYWINKNLFFTALYLEMQLIDPAGRVLLPQRNESPEVPDAGPLPFILHEGIPVLVTDCEVLGPQESITSRTNDLREYFQMKYSGPYSARVDLSSMAFDKAIGLPGEYQCDVNNHEWLGLLKSDTKYIYTQGSTEVNIIPKYWLTFWKEGLYLFPDIAVTIWPEVGKTVNDYRRDGIRLNNVSPKRVVSMYSFLRKTYYLIAFFDKKKAYESLGNDVEVGQWYPVVISGLLDTNQYFGGGQKVKIVDIP
jgi:hypothetical protein